MKKGRDRIRTNRFPGNQRILVVNTVKVGCSETGWTEILARYRRSSLLPKATVDPSLLIELQLVKTTMMFIVFDGETCLD